MAIITFPHFLFSYASLREAGTIKTRLLRRRPILGKFGETSGRKSSALVTTSLGSLSGTFDLIPTVSLGHGKPVLVMRFSSFQGDDCSPLTDAVPTCSMYLATINPHTGGTFHQNFPGLRHLTRRTDPHNFACLYGPGPRFFRCYSLGVCMGTDPRLMKHGLFNKTLPYLPCFSGRYIDRF